MKAEKQEDASFRSPFSVAAIERVEPAMKREPL
jgi:hypothetical protein